MATTARSKKTTAKATAAAAPARGAGLRDQLDRDLLALLQANARASTADLARQLGTARTTVLARLSRLEREGVIAGYTVRLGQDVLDQGLQAFVGITVSPKAGRDVVRKLERMPEVRQLCAVSGEFDYVVLLRAESALRMNTLLDEMGNFDGVVKTTTSVALEWKIDRT
ncbi:MAG: Lrp/AsnC family transcriptional regulator [Burkholderiales bacterium]|nr:Lrp/AsnC family transcriptional regulator [Burkholderiales bacterium]